MASHPRRARGDHRSREDKPQPIIIQNMEFLSPGQRLFRKKPLSTANLFLSPVSLSRQSTPAAGGRGTPAARPAVRDLDLDGEKQTQGQRQGTGRQGQRSRSLIREGEFWRPPAAPATTTPPPSAPGRKRVTFSDSPGVLTAAGNSGRGVGRAGIQTKGANLSDVNNNNNDSYNNNNNNNNNSLNNNNDNVNNDNYKEGDSEKCVGNQAVSPTDNTNGSSNNNSSNNSYNSSNNSYNISNNSYNISNTNKSDHNNLGINNDTGTRTEAPECRSPPEPARSSNNSDSNNYKNSNNSDSNNSNSNNYNNSNNTITEPAVSPNSSALTRPHSPLVPPQTDDVTDTLRRLDQTPPTTQGQEGSSLCLDQHSTLLAAPVNDSPGQSGNLSTGLFPGHSSGQTWVSGAPPTETATPSLGVKPDLWDRSSTDKTTRPGTKTKRVSFKLSDDEGSERASITAQTDASSDRWFDRERYTHTPRDHRGYYQTDEEPSRNPAPKYPQTSGAQNQRKNIPAVPKRSSVRPAFKERGSHRASRNNNTLGTLSEANVKFGSKILRLNFLKDESPRGARDPSVDRTDQSFSRHLDLRRRSGQDFPATGHVDNLYRSASLDNVSSTQSKPGAVSHDVFLTNPAMIGDPFEPTVNPQLTLTSNPTSQPRSQGAVNSDFLMQIYSVSGDKKSVCPQDSTTPQSSTNTASVRHGTEVTHTQDIPPSSSLPPSHTPTDTRHPPSSSLPPSHTPTHTRRPLTVHSTHVQHSRTLAKERRLLSAGPSEPRRTSHRRPARSSSAFTLTRGSYVSRGDGRGQEEEGDMIDRLLLKGEGHAGVSERTVLNRRLEELVVASTHCSRHRLVLERSRSDLV
ncbi:bromodomain-containing protein DDB_G0270170 [Aplysia californica]|uniref:Bromodomain-containing protein DDB_G0270170 n=1 Tax=Aplysia californica TaxID=6500 RepID=A0ABM0KAU5_APLCA|nr:bromodomain-containing protein DDB_G0270170 [Aplysia californica]